MANKRTSTRQRFFDAQRAASNIVEACPVAPLAAEAARMIRVYRLAEALDNEASKKDDVSGEIAAGRLNDFSCDVLRHINERAADLSASSPEGALYQLAFASLLASGLVHNGSDEHSVRHAGLTIGRILYSMRGVIESRTGKPLNPVIADYMMPEHLNPHRALAEAVAQLDAA